MGFWQLFFWVFSFLKPCWCDNINQHFCGNSAFGDEHCNQDEEPLMSIAEIKESKFSKIAFTGKMHFDPKPPLSTSSILAWQSQGCSQSEGLAPLWSPSRDGPHPPHFPVLLSSVCQGCPPCAVLWPASLASLAPGKQSTSRNPGPCLCWRNWKLPISWCRAPHSRSCCPAEEMQIFLPFFAVVHRCSRALRDLQGQERSPEVTMMMSFIGLPVEGVVSRLSWVCWRQQLLPWGWGKAVLCTSLLQSPV